MIRAYTGGNRELQLTSLGDTLGCQVGGPERLRDDDGGVDQFFLKHAVRTVLVGGDDQRVTLRLEKLAQAELAGHAPEQLPRPEIDRLGRWSSLTAGVVINVRNVIACIRSGIPGNGIFVKHTDDLGHGSPPKHQGRHPSDSTPPSPSATCRRTDDRLAAISAVASLPRDRPLGPNRQMSLVAVIGGRVSFVSKLAVSLLRGGISGSSSFPCQSCR